MEAAAEELEQAETQPTPSSSEIISPLSRIPLDIAHHRAALFALETPVQFDQKAWERYWPFIDNVWCLHSKQDAPSNLASGNTEKFWGGCRLQRKWKHGEVNTEGRKRTRREPGQCPAKFRLTVHPSGVRILERSKEGHSHDLDHIDSIKRNSGIRSLVADAFFASWESGPILAYLKDTTNAPPSQPNLLIEAGGKYLERREIINIFAQQLKKAYPTLDASSLKKQKEKYEGVKTCNFKGCNLSFRDGKELVKHRKEAHEERKHDHSGRLYTCPCKTCHRRKRSKGFPTVMALREHQLRMQHWGLGTYYGENGLQYVEGATEADRIAFENGESASGGAGNMSSDGQGGQSGLEGLAGQQPLPDGLPVFPGDIEGDEDLVPIDPEMQDVAPATNMVPDPEKAEMLRKLQEMEAEKARMEQEMERLRSALFAG